MKNKNFDYILTSYLFVLFSRDFEKILEEHKNSDKIIMIKEEDPYYIFCFDNILLIINQTDIYKLSTYFSKNQDSIIYFISKNVSESIKHFKNHGGPTSIQYFTNDDNLIFFKSQISNFLPNLAIKTKTYNYKINQISEFWEIISEPIAGYLIQKSILKNKIDRYKFFDQKTNKIEILENEIINLSILNQGTSSIIEMIYHIKTEKIFISKSFYDLDENGLKLYQREKNNYLMIDHPFLLHYYGSFEEINTKNLIIEYINGKTLHFINEIKLNYNEKLKIIFEILTVMKYLHDNGFIYRDLRPNNIMIDQDKTAVLIDYDRMIKFDDQKNFDEMTTDFTDIFIAPEISKGKSCSFKSDIYSLGPLIYYIFFEKRPKVDDMNKIVIEKNIFPSEYKHLEEIISQCILEHDKRPTIFDLFNLFIDYFFINLYEFYHINKEKLIIFLKISAELNHRGAQYRLANAYLNGVFVPRDINKSLFYYYQSVENNHPIAQFELGNLYYEGIYIKGDINLATMFFLMSANEKYPPALFNLGIIYYTEKSLFDVNKALYYFKLAADQNYLAAFHELGKIYYLQEHVQRDIVKSINYFKIAADNGYADSQFYLGLIYLKGDFISQNIPKSIIYFTMAANQNLVQAQYFLGMIYYDENFGYHNINKAINYFFLASNQNFVEAQYSLGFIYYKCKYIKQDIDKAIHYLTLAANQNHQKAIIELQNVYSSKFEKINSKNLDEMNQKDPNAQLKLGNLYLNGENVEKNIKKAIDYFTLSANQNNSEAQYTLGVIYQEGKYILRDINKSIYYYQLAANNNNCKAQYNLGVLYLRGEFIEKNINKAFYYFTLAANQNFPEAQYNLGMIYFLENKDINKAIHYFTLAANQNIPEAQFNLGDIYINNKDVNKSIHYLQLASKQNHSKSQFLLGEIYFNVEKNVEKGIYYYTLAAKNNHIEAQRTLGDIFFTGKYVKKDLDKAFYYYSLAAENNDISSLNNIGSFYFEGIYVSRDINKALKYYKLAADQNDPVAQYNLGNIFYEGEHVPQDINKAIFYFKMAAKQNDSYAQIRLFNIYANPRKGHLDLHKALYYLTMASKGNEKIAQLILGLHYIQKGSNQSDINNGLNLIIQSAKNYYQPSYFLLGYLFHSGEKIKIDIKNAVHYYKEASSINNQYAKNNLGVIYRNGFNDKIEKNIGYAIEYFNEAIHKSNDLLSMYNLALIYIYDIETESNKSIKLLIDSAIKGFNESLELLCIILIKKNGYNISVLNNEIKKYSEISIQSLFLIISIIENKKLKDPAVLEERFNFYQFNDFIYNAEFNPISLKNVNKNKTKQHNKILEINSSFYDGFGC